MGLKFLGEGEWKHKKHEPEYRRQWRKLLKIDLCKKSLGKLTKDLFKPYLLGKHEIKLIIYFIF